MTMHTTILRAALLSGLIAATLLAQTASKQNNANRNGDPATSGDSKTSSAWSRAVDSARRATLSSASAI
jgi:hypothetical protein